MSWVQYPNNTDFPIQNLPYGVFHLKTETHENARPGVAIGDYVLDLKVVESAGLLSQVLPGSAFTEASLNKFMSMGKDTWKKVRARVTSLLSDSTELKDNADLRQKALIKLSDIVNLLPARIGDYTDFYASREHATNMGKIIRPNEEPLKPNWVWIPVGYHGRSSSVVVSGKDLRRPWGQVKPPTSENPIFKKCGRLDFELEMGTFIGTGNQLGVPIKMENAEDHVFGIVLLNDWSARDIQGWEYIPLGPFNAKNLMTTISPWIVTMDALEPFRVAQPTQTPAPFPYLTPKKSGNFDVKLEVYMTTAKQTEPVRIGYSNFKYMYWSMFQMLVHHTITGCNMQPGDLIGSGTISGPSEGEYGSLMELSWNAQKPITLPSGEQRSFLEDGDTIIIRGWCEGDGYRIGFGDCSGQVLPAFDSVI
eukprot:TRINITY_DN8214_c0_g1_i1.p1 TRINITY_DN8214_c0_g1~~TRINITY_DN8214_c0_g1_i1.p1  ORF type:complete len:421 (-),score=92.21 TRINITY_DN8214_c0_g1_i1:86-1348(-)